MKRIVSIILVICIFILGLQFGINYFKSSHEVDYSINGYVVNEFYNRKDGDYYFFRINVDGRIFVFDVKNSFNKQKMVIEDILVEESNGIFCVAPLYIDDVESFVYCHDGNYQVDFNSVDMNSFSNLINSLPFFDSSFYKDDDEIGKIDSTNYYISNLMDDENVVLYNYKSLLVINNDKSRIIPFSKYDIYHNNAGRLVDNLYVLPVSENKISYYGMMVIDILTGKYDYIYFDEDISSNIYVNGVVDGLIYIVDKSNYVQYELDPVKLNYKIVGSKELGGQLYNGKWSTVSIYDIVKNEVIYVKDYEDIKIDYDLAYESKIAYYYIKDNYFYKLYKYDLNNPVRLFYTDSYREVNLVFDNIYYIKDNYLYRYNIYGNKRVLYNNELKYNYKNIYDVYYK